jgi:hypothetical protein
MSATRAGFTQGELDPLNLPFAFEQEPWVISIVPLCPRIHRYKPDLRAEPPPLQPNLGISPSRIAPLRAN